LTALGFLVSLLGPALPPIVVRTWLAVPSSEYQLSAAKTAHEMQVKQVEEIELEAVKLEADKRIEGDCSIASLHACRR
jgi:hypothetical protein